MDTEKYTCFICWETFTITNEKERKEVISCCRCSHNDYKYAHIRCLKYWVNSSNGSNKKCNICCSPYIIQKSRIPFTTLIKSYWLLAYLYMLLLIASFLISIVTWAKFMIPAAVYIIIPIFNKETLLYENDKKTSIVFVDSSISQKILVLLQTVMAIFLCLFVGKLILCYVEKKTNINKLIGMNPDNQIIAIDLNKDNETSKHNDEEKQPTINDYDNTININIV